MVELVAPGPGDAGRIADLINERSFALHGVREESAAGVARWFAIPTVDPAADMRLAVDAHGGGLGYADVSGPEDGTPKAWVDLRVRADAPEALEHLFRWTETRAAERAGEGGVVHYVLDEREVPLRRLLEEAGYAIVRSSYEMERALDGPLDPPAWPDGFDVRVFREGDGPAVHAANEEAFADHWGYAYESFETWRAFNFAPGEETSLWRIAWDGDEVAGLCINRPRRGEDETVGWVGILAVRRPWRRRGLGEAFLRDAFRQFAAAGKRAAGLGVDAENTTNAVALYERVGMHVVRRSDTWERRV